MKYYCFLASFMIHSLCQAQDQRKEVVSLDSAYKRAYHITKLAGQQPRIDGKLDESIWKDKGAWSDKFSQVIPFERVHTASWTRMKT